MLSRNYAFELNLGANEEPWFPKSETFTDYEYLDKVENKVAGPVRPENRSECEVSVTVDAILIVFNSNKFLGDIDVWVASIGKNALG